MSSKLAQFLHRERSQGVTLVLNVHEVRKSVDELICLLFPEHGCQGRGNLEDIKSQVLKLEKKFAEYFEALAGLDPSLKDGTLTKVEAFFDSLTEIANTLELDVQAALAGDP